MPPVDEMMMESQVSFEIAAEDFLAIDDIHLMKEILAIESILASQKAHSIEDILSSFD